MCARFASEAGLSDSIHAGGARMFIDDESRQGSPPLLSIRTRVLIEAVRRVVYE